MGTSPVLVLLLNTDYTATGQQGDEKPERRKLCVNSECLLYNWPRLSPDREPPNEASLPRTNLPPSSNSNDGLRARWTRAHDESEKKRVHHAAALAEATSAERVSDELTMNQKKNAPIMPSR